MRLQLVRPTPTPLADKGIRCLRRRPQLPRPSRRLSPNAFTPCTQTPVVPQLALWSGRRGSERTVDTSPSGCSGDSASSATCISDKPAMCGRESLVWQSTVASRRPPSVPLRVVVGKGVVLERRRSGSERRNKAVPCQPCSCKAWNPIHKHCDRALIVIEDFQKISHGMQGKNIFSSLICFFPWLHIRSGGIPLDPRRQQPSIPHRRYNRDKIKMNTHRMRP
jgi:hypothetical protein